MAKEKDQKEYDSLVSQKKSKQKQYGNCEDRIEEYDYLLKRLRKAKEVITEEKKNFKAIKKEDKNTVKEKYSWKGSCYNRFVSDGETMKAENENYYENSIDHVLDSLNNEITRIENLRFDDYDLLGKLASAINSLANKIENFFN